ncbi:DUF502 domain-containing protein [Myxococcota bacterium]|nr:DUF502 domain-containing protein [Myxococcota bacterium]MCZ7618978.1 DUF502 domain-containing protein [Myxococcota bacterium]
MNPSPSDTAPRGWFASVRKTLAGYFVAGLLVITPIAVTGWVVAWVVERLDNAILPHLLRVIGLEQAPRIPFVGAIFTILVILLLGVIARHFFGLELLRIGERLLARVPVARSIYGGVKQLLETIFLTSSARQFRRVVLIEYPRKGIYSLAFTTGPAQGLVQDETPELVISCFVPTTPNPTSGFFLLVPERELQTLDMSVEDAFKLIMSAGLVAPERKPGQAANLPPAVPAAVAPVAAGPENPS